MDSVESYELQSFNPNRRTFNNLNEPNKDIEFDFDIGDGFMHPHKADCYMTFELVGAEAGGTYGVNDTMRLINNFFPFFFSQIEVRKHGVVIDKIELPGITSTAIGTLKISKPEATYLRQAGFETYDNLGDRKSVV